MSWWGRIFRRRHLYNDLSEEVHQHIDEKTEQLMRLENLSRTQAREAALRAFGNPSLVEQRSREAWQWPVIESLMADGKLSLRRLRNSPGFAITVILTLAIGIGANTAVFSVVNGVLIKPLPYPEPEQLVALNLNAPGAPGLADFRDGLRLSASMYLTFAAHNRTFQSVGVWEPATANVTGLAQPEQVNTMLVSDGVLQTFAVPPRAGRWLNAIDQDPRGSKRVMLSYGYWQRRFGDRSVVGRTIELDSQPREIVGVMPRGFGILNYDFDLLVPLAFDQHNQIAAGFVYRGIARLKPNVFIGTADTDVARLLNVWMDSWKNCPKCDTHFYLNLEDWSGIAPDERRNPWRHRRSIVGGHGHHRGGDADRLHQCGQPFAGARRRAATGTRRARGFGRRAGPHRAGVADREPAARPLWQHWRDGCRGGWTAAASDHWSGESAASERD